MGCRVSASCAVYLRCVRALCASGSDPRHIQSPGSCIGRSTPVLVLRDLFSTWSSVHHHAIPASVLLAGIVGVVNDFDPPVIRSKHDLT